MGIRLTPQQAKKLGIKVPQEHRGPSRLPANANLPGVKAGGDKDRLVKLFRQRWAELRGPALEEEVRFCKDKRFRFDFASRAAKVAVEIEGGIWMRGGGRHNRPAGYSKDCTKYNIAAALGWTVFRLTEPLIQDRIGLERIIQTIHGKKSVRDERSS